ncbi:MAG: NAD(P)-dependent oxidoreductase [Alphaproteobacteria bacterium]
MKNIVVTGGSGKAGQAVIRELLGHGYAVVNVDQVLPAEPLCPHFKVDLSKFGEAVEALRVAAGIMDRRRPFRAADAVVHLAAIPDTGLVPESVTFETNVTTTYNIFSAATLLGLPRVVWASSETTAGVPFRNPPDFVPITEEHPTRAETNYALSKVLCEEMARQMHRWNPGTTFVGLRFCFIRDEADFPGFADHWDDAHERKYSLWNYVDGRDVARACRLALESSFTGADHFIIAAADTVMTRPSRDLMAEIFPGTPIRGTLGEFETLFSFEKARRVLGYTPRHSWRK